MTTLIQRVHTFFSSRYLLDYRALALMRIAIALICVADLCIRMGDLEAHYSNDGIWPVNVLYNFGWNKGYWSFHTLANTHKLLISLFCIQLLFALLVLLGFKTRFSTILLWLMYISLHNRNIYILQGGDDLLRLVLFWGIFLPWGQAYSLDARSGKSYSANTSASLAFLIFLASVYFFSALLKTSPDWTSTFDAVYYALSLEQIKLPASALLYHHPYLLKIITAMVMLSELLAPLLMLWPSKTGNTRLAAMCLICLLHLGIGLNLFVGLFFLIGIASTLALIPQHTMNTLERIFKIPEQPVQLVSGAFPPWLAWLKTTCIGIVTTLCLLLNIGTLPYSTYTLKSELHYPVNILRLNQHWGMFAPGVLRQDGWFVYYGRDSIGRQWDLRKNQEYVDFSKPERIATHYKNDRWRKLAENMQNDRYTFLRPLYCKYVLKKWNTEHPEKPMLNMDLYFMEKINGPDYTHSVPKKKLHCSCYVH